MGKFLISIFIFINLGLMQAGEEKEQEKEVKVRIGSLKGMCLHTIVKSRSHYIPILKEDINILPTDLQNEIKRVEEFYKQRDNQKQFALLNPLSSEDGIAVIEAVLVSLGENEKKLWVIKAAQDTIKVQRQLDSLLLQKIKKREVKVKNIIMKEGNISESTQKENEATNIYDFEYKEWQQAQEGVEKILEYEKERIEKKIRPNKEAIIRGELSHCCFPGHIPKTPFFPIKHPVLSFYLTDERIYP